MQRRFQQQQQNSLEVHCPSFVCRIFEKKNLVSLGILHRALSLRKSSVFCPQSPNFMVKIVLPVLCLATVVLQCNNNIQTTIAIVYITLNICQAIFECILHVLTL